MTLGFAKSTFVGLAAAMTIWTIQSQAVVWSPAGKPVVPPAKAAQTVAIRPLGQPPGPSPDEGVIEVANPGDVKDVKPRGPGPDRNDGTFIQIGYGPVELWGDEAPTIPRGDKWVPPGTPIKPSEASYRKDGRPPFPPPPTQIEAIAYENASASSDEPVGHICVNPVSPTVAPCTLVHPVPLTVGCFCNWVPVRGPVFWGIPK